MAQLVKKARFKTKEGYLQEAGLFTTLTEVNNKGVPLFLPERSLLDEFQQKFIGWNSFGQNFTLTQGILMPEWNTEEATKVVCTDPEFGMAWHFYGSAHFKVSVFAKNIGAQPVLVSAEDSNDYHTLFPNESIRFERLYYGRRDSTIRFYSPNAPMELILYKPVMLAGSMGYMPYSDTIDIGSGSGRIKKNIVYKDLSLNSSIPFENTRQGTVLASKEEQAVYFKNSSILKNINIPIPMTLEFMVKNTGDYGSLIYFTQNNSDGKKLQLNLGTNRGFVEYKGVSNINIPAVSPVAWTHYAVILTATGSTVFIDGKLHETKTGTASQAFLNNLYIGGKKGWEFFKGYLKYLYITKGIKYTSDFTPTKPDPSTADFALEYTDEQETKAIIATDVPGGGETPEPDPPIILPGSEVYTTAGTYSFTAPAGVTKVKVAVCSGGMGKNNLGQSSSFGNLVVNAAVVLTDTPINGRSAYQYPNDGSLMLGFRIGYDITLYSDGQYGRNCVHSASQFPGGVMIRYTPTGGKDVKTIGVTPLSTVSVVVGNGGLGLDNNETLATGGFVLIEWGGDIK